MGESLDRDANIKIEEKSEFAREMLGGTDEASVEPPSENPTEAKNGSKNL